MADNKATTDEDIKDQNLEELDEPEQEQLEEELDEELEEDNGKDDEAEEPEEEEPEEKPVSRREQLRIQKVLDMLKEKDTPPTKPERPDDVIDYRKQLDAEDEVIERLDTDRNSFGERMYQQGLEESKSVRFMTRLEIDAPRVEAKYPQLDKNSEDFNPALATAINGMYLANVGYDATTGRVRNDKVRYSDYVESIFELADEVATVKVADTRRNITKQAASTGMRPDGSATKKLNLNKAPGDMSDQELDAYLKKVGFSGK